MERADSLPNTSAIVTSDAESRHRMIRMGPETSVGGGGTTNQSETQHHDVIQSGRSMSWGRRGSGERETDCEGWRERVKPLQAVLVEKPL